MFSSTAGLGHVLPLLPLARATHKRGHEVVWATAGEVCPRIAAAGLDTRPVGLPVDRCLGDYARRWPEGGALEGRAAAAHMFPRLFGVVAAEAAVAGLASAAGVWRPDVVVHEPADFAAPAVAAALGVPNATHALGLAIPEKLVAAAGEQAAGVWRHVGVEARPYGGCYDHLYIDICPPSMQADGLGHVARSVGLRPGAPDAVAGGRLPEPLAERLAAERSRAVVHLTFGTIFADLLVIARVARALARLDALVVVTGPFGGGEGDLRALPPNVHLAGMIAHGALLPHCSAVVSHAGAGTMFKALARGLPQLCLPQAPSDQYRNAAACAAAGAAIALVGDEASDDAIEGAARRLLDEPAFRFSAQRVRAEIASMPTPEDVVGRLEQLV
jgi:UDP:flavonoid glycosyltransferase YjiC (YdhE family)